MKHPPRPQPGRRVQLHRALSKLGWGSRTQAWQWIRGGEVRVDGRVVTDPLTWVDLDRQQVTRGGHDAVVAQRLVLALNKPRGIVTTRRDERGRPTVYDLLPPGLPWVFPAGRLDADSEGLLILTNDSALATRLTEPAEHVPKTYRVTVKGIVTDEILDKLRNGLELADGRTRPAQVRVLENKGDAATVEMALTQGRNRQIRRMWTSVGCRVRALQRIAIGAYTLGDLQAGATIVLDAADVHKLTPIGFSQSARRSNKPRS